MGIFHISKIPHINSNDFRALIGKKMENDKNPAGSMPQTHWIRWGFFVYKNSPTIFAHSCLKGVPAPGELLRRDFLLLLKVPGASVTARGLFSVTAAWYNLRMDEYNDLKFAAALMRIYDRKIRSGEITFFSSGITKMDFTNMCVNGDYVIPDERLEIVFEKMQLSIDEIEMLREKANAGK